MVRQKNDKDYIDLCRDRIVQKLNWPPTGDWRNYEFTQLGDKVFDKTNIQLSTTTLKRVFGKVKYESYPSSVTLNALAQFLDYENWMDFKANQFVEKETFDDAEPIAQPLAHPAKKKINLFASQKFFLISLSLLALTILLGFVLFSKNMNHPVADFKNVVFTSRPTAEGLPNSVVFKVNLQNIKSGNIRIQQSWDSSKTIALKNGQTEATGIYYIPGYFRAKLLVDDKIIREHDLFIKSNGWMATIDDEPVPVYLKKNELNQYNGLTVDSSVMTTLKKADRPVTLTYHFVQPFEQLDGDNFTLDTEFQNTLGDGAAVCRTVKVAILCTNGAFIIPFTIPGCVSDVNLKLNDVTLYGKSNDLSIFGIDMVKPVHLKLQVDDRNVNIFYNSKILYRSNYSKKAGKIVGLRYSFLGAGKVGRIKMQNKNGVVVYENKFNGHVR